MSEILTFFVHGKAEPAGSKKSFAHPHTKKIVTIDDNPKAGPWKKEVAAACRTALAVNGYVKFPVYTEGVALYVEMTFYIERPKYHYGTGKNADKIKEQFLYARPTVKPDTTKLVRCAEDALTGLAWHDDAQIVRQVNDKQYGDKPGIRIVVIKMDDYLNEPA